MTKFSPLALHTASPKIHERTKVKSFSLYPSCVDKIKAIVKKYKDNGEMATQGSILRAAVDTEYLRVLGDTSDDSKG